MLKHSGHRHWQEKYDNAQGIWYFSFDCGNEFDVSDFGVLPNSVDVKGEGDNQLTFELYISDQPVSVDATINDNGDINIDPQNVTITIMFFPITVEVSGFGSIESADSGTLNLTYKNELLSDTPISCISDLSREGEQDEDSDE